MYVSQKVAERIKEVAKKRNVSIRQLLNDVNLGFNMMSNMKTSMPKADNLAKIADYLECSVDYLLGRTDEPNSIFGELKSGSQVSDIELLYDILDSEDKAEIRGIIKGMLLADKYKHIPRSTTNAV